MFGYDKSTAADHYDAVLDHLDALHDKFKDEESAAEQLRDRVEELQDDLQTANGRAESAEKHLNTAYSQRAIAAISLAHTVLHYGGTAGIGYDNREDQPSNWRVVLYVDTPAGQLSWHIAPDDQPMLEGLPDYSGKWDGTYNSSRTDFYKGFKR